MSSKKRSDIDLDDTVELPVIDEQDPMIRKKDPIRIIFAFVIKAGIFFFTVLSITLIAMAIYTNYHSTNLELVDESKIIFTGYNGSGVAQFHNNPEKSALTELQKKKKQLENSNQDTTTIVELIDSIDCSFSQSSNLANGMKITYGCSYNKEAAKHAHYAINSTHKEYIVMGLLDSSTIDPFESMATTFDTNGISITNTQDATLQYSYIYQGDEITIYSNNKSITLLLADVLSDELKHSIESMAQSELDACHHTIQFGKESFDSYSPTFQSIQKNEDETFTVKLSLSNLYTETLSDYYSFTISYTGTFVNNEDGTIVFQTINQHGCTYDGNNGSYFVIEKDAKASY